MSASVVLLIGIMLVTLSSGTRRDLNNATMIKLCVKKAMEALRDQHKSELDPLYLQTTEGYGKSLQHWELKNPTVRGLEIYSLEEVDVHVSNTSAITVSFVPTWLSVSLAAGGRYNFCNKTKTIFGHVRRRCMEAGGPVTILVNNPTGRVAILLEPSLYNNQVQLEPTSQIGVNFLKVSVNISLNKASKRIDSRFGSPSKIYKNGLLNHWKNTVETLIADKILSQLRKVANTYLPERLAISD